MAQTVGRTSPTGGGGRRRSSPPADGDGWCAGQGRGPFAGPDDLLHSVRAVQSGPRRPSSAGRGRADTTPSWTDKAEINARTPESQRQRRADRPGIARRHRAAAADKEPQLPARRRHGSRTKVRLAVGTVCDRPSGERLPPAAAAGRPGIRRPRDGPSACLPFSGSRAV